MRPVIEVGTGEVCVAQGEVLLRASALGSCVCVVLGVPHRPIGAMAHVMLPGAAPPHSLRPDRYALNALENTFRRLRERGVEDGTLVACLIGGANVLQRPDDTICESNMASVREALQHRGIPIAAQSLGGVQRRSVCLDVTDGIVRCSQGDAPERILFEYRTEPVGNRHVS